MGELEDMTRSARDARYRYIRHYHPDRSPMQHCDYPDHLDTWREMRRLTSGEAGQRAKGLRRSILTPLQRTLVAPTKPEEELYDLLEDPHETQNLAGLAEHSETLERFRAAVDGWQAEYGDLGFIPEDELLERWRPGGVWPVTAAPDVRLSDAGIEADSPTDGAVTVWTADPPVDGVERPPTAADRMGSPADAIGAPVHDGRAWKLLTAATPPPPGVDLWFKACRLGFLESDEVHLARARRLDAVVRV